MNPLALLRSVGLAATLLIASRALAQEATLTTASTALSGNGDLVTLTATVSYDKAPAALAWSLETPAAWELVTVGGTDQPDIKPEAGTTGALEFAYMRPPEKGGVFTVTVRL